MKAKVIRTGEIVNVDWYNYDGMSVIYREISTTSARTFYETELEFIRNPNDPLKPINKIDWEQRRYEFAKSAMQGILTNMTRGSAFSDYENKVAIQSIQYADAVIAKLKES